MLVRIISYLSNYFTMPLPLLICISIYIIMFK